MNIGILTFHRSENYGAYLQAYALSKTLQDRYPKCKVEIIDYDSRKSKKYYWKVTLKEGVKFNFKFNYFLKRKATFKNTLSELPLSKEKCFTDDMDQFRAFINDKYDIIIAGSDQIWKVNSFRGFPNAYWLPVTLSCKKMSYATSSRSLLSDISIKHQESIKEYLSSFEYIGVRDDVTYETIKEITTRDNIHINCDPVFLLDFKYSRKDGKACLKKVFKIDSSKPTIGLMTRSPEIVREICDQFKNSCNVVSLNFPHNGTKYNASLTPFEFAASIAGLDFLVTSYFHGLCFALKSDVNVIALEEKAGEGKANSKMLDLLLRLNLGGIYIEKGNNDYKTIVVKEVKNTIHDKKDNPNYNLKPLVKNSNSFFEELDRMILHI